MIPLKTDSTAESNSTITNPTSKQKHSEHATSAKILFLANVYNDLDYDGRSVVV